MDWLFASFDASKFRAALGMAVRRIALVRTGPCVRWGASQRARGFGATSAMLRAARARALFARCPCVCAVQGQDDGGGEEGEARYR